MAEQIGEAEAQAFLKEFFAADTRSAEAERVRRYLTIRATPRLALIHIPESQPRHLLATGNTLVAWAQFWLGFGTPLGRWLASRAADQLDALSERLEVFHS